MSLVALCLLAALQVAVQGATISFTGCRSPNWMCLNNSPDDVTYTCSVFETESTIHVKDYRLEHSSVTVQNCKHIKVAMDCVSTQRHSRLSNFEIRNSDKLEFIAVRDGTPSQTPSQLVINNVKEIASLPQGLYKSPITSDERKCLGTLNSRSLIIRNSKLNVIKERAIYNATGIQKIEFKNVTLGNIEKQAIDTIMVGLGSSFTLNNCKIDNIKTNSVILATNTAIITDNIFGDVLLHAINITANKVKLLSNSIDKIEQSGFCLVGTATDITNNNIGILASNALADIRCSRRRVGENYLNFSNNTIRDVRPYSLWFDFASCQSSNSLVTVKNNKMQCKCQEMTFLTTTSLLRQELNNLILDLNNNNTCLSAPCILPIEMVKTLMDSHICQVNLNMQVICMLYYDNKRNSTASPIKEEDDMTEEVPTFYLIRQANVPNGSASAAMTSIDKNELLRNTGNITQRTTIRVVFDASRDFADMLRSTSAAHRRRSDRSRPTERVGLVGHCTGSNCRNASFDRQKALDFYKYVYAQLRPPRTNQNKNATT